MGATDDPCGDYLVPDLPRAVVLDPRFVGVVTHFNRLRRTYGAQQAGQGASLHDDRALRCALVITRLFTLLPGRLIGRALGGDEGEASLMHAARLPDWVVANEDDPVRHARFEVGNSIRRYPPMLARSNRLPARRWPSAACRRVGCGLTFLRVHV